jgi:hypothetical protein
MYRKRVVEEIRTRISCAITFFFNLVVYENLKNVLERGREHDK